MAVLTAIGCMAACLPVVPAAALSKEEQEAYLDGTGSVYAVYGANFRETTNAVSYVNMQGVKYGSMMNIGCSEEPLRFALAGEDPPQAGDILYVRHSGEVAEIYPGCMHLSAGDLVENIGNVWDLPTIDLTITSIKNSVNTLVDAEGNEYTYNDTIDTIGGWEPLGEVGDTVTLAQFGDKLMRLYGEPDAAPYVEELMLDFAVVSADDAAYTLCGLNDEVQGALYTIPQEFAGDLEIGELIRIRDLAVPEESGMPLVLNENAQMTALGSAIDLPVAETYTVDSCDEEGAVLISTATGISHTVLSHANADWSAYAQGSEILCYSYKDQPLLPIGESHGDFSVLRQSADDSVYLLFGMNGEHKGRTFYLSAEDASRCLTGAETLEASSYIMHYCALSGDVSFTETDGTSTITLGENAVLVSQCGVRSLQYSMKRALCTVASNDGKTLTLTSDEFGSTDACIDWVSTITPNSTVLSGLAAGDMLYYQFYDGIPMVERERYYPEDHLDSMSAVVIAEDDAENPQNFVVSDGSGNTYYISAQLLSDFGVEGQLQYGDTILLYGTKIMTELDGTNTLSLDVNEKGACITPDYRDNLFTASLIREFTVSGTGTGYLDLTRNDTTYRYWTDYADAYIQPLGDLDYASMAVGDTVRMITYGSRPMLPIEEDIQSISMEVSNYYSDYCILNGCLRVEYADLLAVNPAFSENPPSYGTHLRLFVRGELQNTYPAAPAELAYALIGYASGTEEISASQLRKYQQAYMEFLASGFAVTEVIRGDSYTDGELNIQDVIFLSQCIMGAEKLPAEITQAAQTRADFNADSLINSADLMAMLRQLAGLA